MFIFVVQTLQKKWNEIRMKELAGGKFMENDCFLRTLKFEMLFTTQEESISTTAIGVQLSKWVDTNRCIYDTEIVVYGTLL
jgi:hypothetical protein